MQLPAYLTISRHGVFYFRWPLPLAAANEDRRSIRLSLGTRCPQQAARLSRYLATCGASLGRTKGLGDMRHDDLRRLVHRFFKDRLAVMLDGIGADGPMSELKRAPLHTSQTLADGPLDSFRTLALPESEAAFLARFCASAGLPQSEAEARPERLLGEIQAAWRDMLREFEKHHAALNHYDFNSTVLPALASEAAPTAAVPQGISLASAIAEYIAENRLAKSWEHGTFDKKQATLDVLTELLSADIAIAAVSKHHARDVKQVVSKLPPNRNKQQATRDLSIREAAALPGIAPMATVTVNAYISIYQSFFDWAEKNGHTEVNPFEGMRVLAGRNESKEQRQAFKPEALQAVYAELTQNSRGLAKKPSHKWASLIGMFSGARLNEICQLEATDLQEQDGIWYFNLFDSDDVSNKKFKTAAARRKVPVHSRLLELGLLDYHRDVASRTTSRLFPDYSFEPKAGYGRSLGRWFNDVLTPALGIKSKAHVFHGLRHTMVTRLLQAGVEETVCQSIVGHERKGVTQGTYNREGYTLLQLQQAINRFPVPAA